MANGWIGRCLALCVLASGCAGAPSAVEPITQLPTRVETAAADEGSFALVIETSEPASGYRTQYVNALDWEVADGTLSNGDATIHSLTRTAAVTVDGQLVRRATLFFAPIKPAGNYTLAIQLKRRDRTGTYQVVASGTKPSLTLAPGANTATVTLTPTAQGQLTVSLPKPAPSFIPPPTISSAAPLTGSAGMLVTLSGSNFGATAGANAVSFNGAVGPLQSAGSTRVVAQVPSGVTTGALTLTVPNWPAVGVGTFTKVASGTSLGSFGTGAGPQGLDLDADGNLWVANFSGTTLSKFTPTSSTAVTVPIGSSSPISLAFDASGNAWVAVDTNPGKVVRVSAAGTVLGTTTVGSFPTSIAFDASGNAWVGNTGSGDITKIAPDGTVLGTFGDGVGGSSPSRIHVAATGQVWSANSAGSQVSKLNSDGSLAGVYSVGSRPGGLAIDGAGAVWVSVVGSASVVKLSAAGVLQATYPVGIDVLAMAFDPLGNLWACGASSAQVVKLSSAGAVLGTYALPARAADITFDQNRAATLSLPSLNSVVKLAL